MRIPAALCLPLAAFPCLALAGMVNAAPVIDSVGTIPSPAIANDAAVITCAAHDPDGVVKVMKIAVSGGTLPGGATSASVAISSGASVQGQISWATPAAGTYSVTCTVSDNGGLFSGPATVAKSASVIVAAPAGNAPVIDALLPSSSSILAGGQVTIAATAHDPDGGPLTYAWGASAGTLAGAGEQVTWTAPGTAGGSTLSLTVTDATGLSATSTLVLQVALAFPEDALRALFRGPRRIASSAQGDMLVVDSSGKQLWLITRNGLPKANPQLPDAPAAVASCPGALWAATAGGRLFSIDPVRGEVTSELAIDGQPLSGPWGMACDPASSTLFVAERDSDRVRAIRPDGTTAFALTSAGTAALSAPVDVAVDAEAGLLWVLLDSNEGGSQLHAFSLSGAYVRSAAPYGTTAGSITRGGGLAVGPGGMVFASDAFQSVIESYDRTGAPRGELGAYGDAPGQLRQPAGLAALPNGDLVVANLDHGRLERFGEGGPLPSCPGDTDCDGLPDAWEQAYGLSPIDARDALADNDGDGLINLDEYARGTRPDRWDTDGDGYSDGDEVHNGFDPLDPNDHRPVLVAGAAVASDPGYVRMSSVLRGGSGCAVAWAQAGGPPVVLRGANTLSPSFVGREAGAYTFAGQATCGSVQSDAAVLRAEIREVAPRPSAGGLLVVHAGKSFLLDGQFSSDANGGPLALQWDQLLGPPALGSTAEVAADVQARQPALYSFQLTARDQAGNEAAAELPVLVVSEGRQAPTAMASTPVYGTAGRTVALDASASIGAPGHPLAFSWTQTAGPPAPLSAASGAAVSFVPQVAGRYDFEVTASDEALRSPPAKVVAYVDLGAGLPVALAPAGGAAVVGDPISLDGSASTSSGGGALAYRWRQVSGPAAGLTDANAPAATVVPFDAGSYVFELVVSDGPVESLPAFVRVDAQVAGHLLPVASARAPSLAQVDDRVSLDGSRSSDGDGHALAYRWTQVDGPWVALDDATAAQPTFQPNVPGLYAFELVVDDGAIQSAPARAGVLVLARGANGGAR